MICFIKNQASSEPEVEKLLILLTSDIPSYDLPGLNVVIPYMHSADASWTRSLNRFAVNLKGL